MHCETLVNCDQCYELRVGQRTLTFHWEVAHICSQQLKSELLAPSQPHPLSLVIVPWGGSLDHLESSTLGHTPLGRTVHRPNSFLDQVAVCLWGII